MIRRTLMACTLALLSACASAPQPGDELVLDAGRPREGWHVTLADFENQVRLAGDATSVPKLANPKVPDSVVSARRGSRSGRSDALTMTWRQAWFASLRLEGGPPLDLRPFVAEGTLEFDIDVVEMARGGLTFTMGCGKDCTRKLPYMLPSRALQGRGWQHLAFALRCFVRDGDDLSAVTQAFTMDSSGSGEAAIANLRFVRRGRPNAACPDYRTQSVTPEPLTQVWALDWWMPRHRKKLDEIAARRAQGQRIDLVFIGDSITHGWEEAGAPVWQRQFAPRGALNLGYGGDKTENVLWRLQHGELDGYAPKVVVLMIGTNNTGDRMEDPVTTVAGIRRIVDEIRSRQPQTKVLLLAVFPRDEKPDSPLRLNNDRINRLLPALADGRQVRLLDIGPALMNADGTLSRDVMPDLLHLSEKGYAQWARAIEPTLATLLAPAAP